MRRISFLGRTPAELRANAAALRQHARRDLRNAHLCEAAAKALESKTHEVTDPCSAPGCPLCHEVVS